MQHAHDNIFAGCLTFRDFCQIFNATHLFSLPPPPPSPPGFPIPAESWYPWYPFCHTHTTGQSRTLRVCASQCMCGQTTCDVVLTAYCDKCVKRIYENTPFPGTREKARCTK